MVNGEGLVNPKPLRNRLFTPFTKFTNKKKERDSIPAQCSFLAAFCLIHAMW
jgi:hypothetical protein